MSIINFILHNSVVFAHNFNDDSYIVSLNVITTLYYDNACTYLAIHL